MGVSRLKFLCVVSVLALALSACHDDNDVVATQTPPPTSTTQDFSTFTENIFAMYAYTYPVNFDDVTLVYDVNEDPTAFNALLM